MVVILHDGVESTCIEVLEGVNKHLYDTQSILHSVSSFLRRAMVVLLPNPEALHL